MVGQGGDRLLVLQVLDITERKRFEGQLQHLADHDPLTGLLQPPPLRARSSSATSPTPQRYGQPGALLVLDLDNFKYVNDTLGHAVGDELIGRVARAAARAPARHRHRRPPRRRRVRRAAAADDALEDAEAIAPGAASTTSRERTSTRARGRQRPRHALDRHRARSSPAARADARRAARRGRHRHVRGEGGRPRPRRLVRRATAPTAPARMRARLSWSERIREALEHDRFVLFQQPILDLARGDGRPPRAAAAHADGDGGDLIPPGRVPLRRRALRPDPGDRPLGRSRGRSSCSPRARPRAGERIALEVNLSGDVDHRPAVLDFIASRGRATPAIDPTQLIFEVTETAAIVNIERARQLRRAARRARLPVRARRLRRRLRLLLLPQAPAVRLPEDRRRLHQGAARRARRTS